MGRGEGRGRGETSREEAKRGEEEREARVGERLAGQHARRHKRGAAGEYGHVEGGIDDACGTCPRPVTAILPTTSAALCGAVEDARAAVDGAVLGLQPQQAVQLLPVPVYAHTVETQTRGEASLPSAARTAAARSAGCRATWETVPRRFMESGARERCVRSFSSMQFDRASGRVYVERDVASKGESPSNDPD